MSRAWRRPNVRGCAGAFRSPVHNTLSETEDEAANLLAYHGALESYFHGRETSGSVCAAEYVACLKLLLIRLPACWYSVRYTCPSVHLDHLISRRVMFAAFLTL